MLSVVYEASDMARPMVLKVEHQWEVDFICPFSFLVASGVWDSGIQRSL